MSTNKTDINNKTTDQTDVNKKKYDDEIELRDLIMILWNRKALIIAITLICALLAGLFSNFYITPVYNTKFSIVVNIPATYTTKYGDYTLPISSSNEYVNLIKSSEVIQATIEDLGYEQGEVSVQGISDRISFESTGVDGQSVYTINVSGSSPESALELANMVYDNYVKSLNVMIKERAINYYYNESKIKVSQNEMQISSEKDLLARQEALLEETPKTIDQKSAMAEIPNTSDFIVLENIINPNYTQLEYNILEIKQNINILENESEEYAVYIKELEEDQGDRKSVV